MKKKLISLLKRRELYFVITVYPAFYLLVRYLKNFKSTWIKDNYNFYAFTSLAAFIFILLLVFSEVGMKLYSYGLQGDKLKIRENEGISIGDINNGKRKN